MSLESMSLRLERYCSEHGLPHLSAEDLEYELAGNPSKEAREHTAWLQRFIETWNRVCAEHIVVQRLCIEALKHGYEVVLVDDGEERYEITGAMSLSDIVDLASAADESTITVRGKTTSERIRFHLVFGNSAGELIADHTDHPDAQLIWDAVQKGIKS